METNSPDGKFNSDWKTKLEDVAGLQETALPNRDVVWEKLHARLAEKPRTKRIVWYWLAAASVLAAIMISLITINKTTIGISQHNNTPNVQKSENDKPVKNVSPEITPIETKAQLQKNTFVKNAGRKPAITDTPESTQYVIKDQENLQPQTFTVPVVVDTAVSATISSIPVQKKLKVVHVNELGEPVEFPADVAHSSDLHLFQLKLAQQEIYNASSIASNSSSVPFFKPKNSPN